MRPSDLVNRENATEFEAAYKFGEILTPFEKQQSREEGIDLLPVRYSQPTVSDKIDMSPAAMPTHKYVPLLPAEWFRRGLDR